jgi:hypothetical protein
MNWGYKILFVYIAFVLGILLMVYKSSTQKVDLVTADYYARELKYQDKIDETTRANALSLPVKCEIINGDLTITFPKDFAGKKLSGQVVLYCPSNENKDLITPFSIEDSILTIHLPAANKGLHEIQISWMAESLKYYFQQKLFI